MSSKCYKCGSELHESFNIIVSRTDSCPKCMADIKCCKMCKFYDSTAYNECKEFQADRVADKEKANFCDYFKLTSSYNDPDKARQDALAKANALFKK